jgi:hypothetical protein
VANYPARAAPRRAAIFARSGRLLVIEWPLGQVGSSFFASQAAIAIHNAQPFADADWRRHEAETLSDLGRTLARALDGEIGEESHYRVATRDCQSLAGRFLS